MSTPAPGVAPAPPVPPAPTDRRTKFLRWLSLAIIVAVFAAAFLLPLVNISRYHHTIAETLSRSVGRPVHLGSVKLQLLPRPGLAISDFSVEEDSRFGAEPLLRAPTVTVSMRFISLWRGRLEVSRIDLEDASVNLARDSQGQWNFASLLNQASHTSTAPTAQRHASASPRFPYIDFRNARINFKSGNEKHPFSFFNCDLSIWLDQPQQWRLRFEGQPARTDLDLDLSDTGLIRVEGSLDRAPYLDQMAVKLHAEWNGAPIGQVSRLTLARDVGWRGDLRADADISGDVRDLHLHSRLRVANVHREEFTPLTPFNIDATCQAAYRHGAHSLDDITCFWPVESGHLLLTGNVKNLLPHPQSQLSLEINHTPASFALNTLGLLRRGLPSSAQADGLINGHFSWSNITNNIRPNTPAGTAAPSLSGQAVVTPLSVTLPDAPNPIAFPPLRFTAPPANPQPRHHGRHPQPAATAAARPLLVLEPASLAMGVPNPLQLSGQLTPEGFDLHLGGGAALSRLAPWIGSFAVLRSSLFTFANGSNSQGIADLDLALHGPWLVATVPVDEGRPHFPTIAQGTLRIQHTQAKLSWLPAPVQITSATASFSPGQVTWSNASLTINGVPVQGSAAYSSPCADPAGCAAHLNLDVATLDAATLQSALLGTGHHGEIIDAILAEVGRKTSPWPAIDGTVHIGTFSLGRLVLHNARALLSVRNGQLKIDSLDADTLGGLVHVGGNIAKSGSGPQYSLDLSFSGVKLSDAAAIFHENWGGGSLDGGANLTLQGFAASDLVSSARGTFHWNWSQGSLPLGAKSAAMEPASLTRATGLSPQHFTRWMASGTIGDGHLTIAPDESGNAITGTISFNRELDLTWPEAKGQPLHLGGTLAHPALEATPSTPAR